MSKLREILAFICALITTAEEKLNFIYDAAPCAS